MASVPFYIVDVFAVKPYSGNQLAVILNGGDLTTEMMQTIAKEINFSETTFILGDRPENGGYPVRIFTPTQELPFAGHPTLGTAYIIQQAIIASAVHQVTLNLKVGQIPVHWQTEDQGSDILWMTQNPPEFTETYWREEIAPILSLKPEDIDDKFPIQTVSTGIPFVIVPLKNKAALKQCRIQQSLYYEFIEDKPVKMIFVFCPETEHPENTFSARMFADYLGVPEDPATGSANGCFAGYLVEHNYLGTQEINVRVEQGYEINRPSLLRLRAKRTEDRISVEVGGAVISIAKGEFFF
ncbi:PhzF family phenazine biosynthesis protein [Roseofilum sp. BLCC_M154]|uniref:PhzF family phenazine biosynthesis protein n=1 Tax=Roseofilum acuticapitatum BLCC-M154 TaxID=3022444 RepID=A0ABT7AR25_9CYAN|nr:PhzF family phenazine biosynthesis protein [Roseofilum acuticapitatum]MDJ1169345.1 PhzF family phenazine biosynthesis protein [Roseofilum acuticapitatum BLCC-M154]